MEARQRFETLMIVANLRQGVFHSLTSALQSDGTWKRKGGEPPGSAGAAQPFPSGFSLR